MPRSARRVSKVLPGVPQEVVDNKACEAGSPTSPTIRRRGRSRLPCRVRGFTNEHCSIIFGDSESRFPAVDVSFGRFSCTSVSTERNPDGSGRFEARIDHDAPNSVITECTPDLCG